MKYSVEVSVKVGQIIIEVLFNVTVDFVIIFSKIKGSVMFTGIL
jgi:hypothetical protein